MGPERPRGGFKRLVDDLYYGEVSGHAPIDNAAPEAGIQFSPKVLEKYLRKLYGGDFDVSTDIEPSAWREVLRILNDAVATGISQSDAAPTLEQDFYDRLRHSNEVFSAFKVHSMGKRMAALLTDESGQLKPFHKWRDEVMPIASHYVGPWLRTEYNTAVNRAHDAADWKQFERNSDIMPNLRWMPTTSAEPDAEHRIFWKMKLTRPIDDPFWNKHRPGDHWNCKCTLEQTDDPATDIPAGADDEAPQPGLKGNPAKTGQIFDRSHPYFPKSCKGCTFAKGFKNKLKGFFNAEGDCYKCGGVKTLKDLPIKELRNKVIKDKLFTTEKDLSTHSNLRTKNILRSPKVMERFIKHVHNYEEYEAAQFAWNNFDKLVYDRKSVLGEGKDLSNPKDMNNIIKKRRRGVVCYHIYTFNYGGKTWEIKLEEHKQRFEQAYSVNKKRS